MALLQITFAASLLRRPTLNTQIPTPKLCFSVSCPKLSGLWECDAAGLWYKSIGAQGPREVLAGFTGEVPWYEVGVLAGFFSLPLSKDEPALQG